MVTKAIIVKVEDTEAENGKVLRQYRVRMPIFHGYGDADAIPDSELPLAGTCLPPKMFNSTFLENDIVYVSIENLDTALPVIIGMAPMSSTDGLNGSMESNASLGMQNVTELYSSPDADKFVLPYNTIIRASSDPKDYEKELQEGFVDNELTKYVTSQSLSYLRGVVDPILGQIDNTNSLMLSTFSSLMNLTAVCEPAELPLNLAKWVDSGDFAGIDVVYVFNYNSDSKLYSVEGTNRNYDLQGLNNLGIGLTKAAYGRLLLFKIKIIAGPITINMGGTGGSSAAQARENLGLKLSKFISAADWDAASQADLETNTIYYIYQE